MLMTRSDVDFEYALAAALLTRTGWNVYENPRCEKTEKGVSQPTDETVKKPSLESQC